jgi:hypothetical protein
LRLALVLLLGQLFLSQGYLLGGSTIFLALLVFHQPEPLGVTLRLLTVFLELLVVELASLEPRLFSPLLLFFAQRLLPDVLLVAGEPGELGLLLASLTLLLLLELLVAGGLGRLFVASSLEQGLVAFDLEPILVAQCLLLRGFLLL